MSHTATCGEQEHGHPAELLPVAAERGASAVRARPIRGLSAVPEVRWSALALMLFGLGAIGRVAEMPDAVSWPLFAGCYLCGGWEPALAGIRALQRRTLDVDLLMIVAALVAAGIGQVLDGGLLIVIFATSGALEVVATKRTRDSVRSLLDLSPARAVRIEPDGSEAVVGTGMLVVGDVVVVRPGERIGADGVVIDGASEVDEASITGEPLPAFKESGAEVFAGTLNGTGVLRVRVERAATDTVVARIVNLVEEASATKAKSQLFIEKVEQRYSTAVVVATLALFALRLLLGGALQPTLLRAMTFMIVASPCAVVLATMPPLLSAIANAGRHGVLVKSAVVMELLGRTEQVAFDKTGTLTLGVPGLVDVRVLPGSGITTVQLLRLAAGAETGSEHPLGRAVVSAATARGLRVPPASSFEALPGRGVKARVEQRLVEVRSPLLRHDTTVAELPESEIVADLRSQGLTVVVVELDGQAAGVLALSDQARPDANTAVASLTRVTKRRPVLMTGDNPVAAGLLGDQVGISDIRAGLLPQDKVATVHALQADGTPLAVIGDGVNDAPSLVAAHVGLAMGRHGADLTLEAADAVLVRDELTAVPAVIALSRRARRVITQNLCFAAAVICTLVAVDLLGHLPLPLGVAGHEGSTVLVGLNGLRLLRSEAWSQNALLSSASNLTSGGGVEGGR